MSVPLHPDWNSAQVLQKLHVGTGTSKCGTGTKSVMVLHCLGVPVPVYLVPVPLPLQLHLFTVALPEASRQQLPSTTMIYICSLDMNPYKNVHETRKNLHTHKNTRNNQRHLFYTK